MSPKSTKSAYDPNKTTAPTKTATKSPFSSLSPAVIMKMDVEGSELEVMEDLIVTGELAGINRTLVEWHEVRFSFK